MEEHTKFDWLDFNPSNDQPVMDPPQTNARNKRINPYNSERLFMQEYGRRLDAERDRKHKVIIQFLLNEARLGKFYTRKTFAEKFKGKKGLRGKYTILDRLSVLATKGYITFIKDLTILGLSKTSPKCSFLCVQGMVFVDEKGINHPVVPTHFKCLRFGGLQPLTSPYTWPFPERDDLK